MSLLERVARAQQAQREAEAARAAEEAMAAAAVAAASGTAEAPDEIAPAAADASTPERSAAPETSEGAGDADSESERAEPVPAAEPGTTGLVTSPSVSPAPTDGSTPAAAPSAALVPTAPPRSTPPGRSPTMPVRSAARAEMLQDVRIRLQEAVVGAFSALIDVPPAETRRHVESIVDRVVATQAGALTRDERARFVEEIIDDITGLGPIEPLLQDESITEVMVNGPSNIYIERRGKIQRVDTTFLNDEHVMRVIDRIITPMGRRIDETSPRVDARLPDGSRVNAIIEPLSLVGPVITIRKFSTNPFTIEDLVRFGTATSEMFEFLRSCIEARLNVFVSGGTGSGKTTTLNVLSSFIPRDERIVTIEDAAELQLRQEHVVTLESRPANLEGEGEITIRHLLRNAMHMRPDRVIVGECRAGEALDMLQAMTTGHDGSLSTGHANSPKDMLRRLETMVLMTGYQLPLRAIREQIASAVDLIVHTARLKDGTRKITHITEIYGTEDDEILTQDIFTFQQTGVDEDGKIIGKLTPTGVRPTFMHIFRLAGVDLPPGEFGIPPEDPDRPIRPLKGRWGGGQSTSAIPEAEVRELGLGRAVSAGGMVYVSAIGPVDPEAGQVMSSAIKDQARQCMENLKAKLESCGTSLDKVVWANWSLRDATEFDAFNEEWARWFPDGAPLGQMTLMPPLQKRAGFRVALGVIAQA